MVETVDDFAARGESDAVPYADGDADSYVVGALAVLGLPVALTSWRQATARIEHWAAAKDPQSSASATHTPWSPRRAILSSAE